LALGFSKQKLSVKNKNRKRKGDTIKLSGMSPKEYGKEICMHSKKNWGNERGKNFRFPYVFEITI